MCKKKNITLLWTQEGCIKCEDFRNAHFYDEAEDLIEYSLNDAEGLSLAFFYEMSNHSGEIETPCLYVGPEEFYGLEGEKFFGDDIVEYLKEKEVSKNE